MQCDDAKINAAVAYLVALLPGVDSDQSARLQAAIKFAVTAFGGESTPKARDGTGSTAEFAASRNVKPRTVLRRYYAEGSYFGEKPVKTANGRLRWPIGEAK
jgi:hypothetical protein